MDKYQYTCKTCDVTTNLPKKPRILRDLKREAAEKRYAQAAEERYVKAREQRDRELAKAEKEYQAALERRSLIDKLLDKRPTNKTHMINMLFRPNYSDLIERVYHDTIYRYTVCPVCKAKNYI